MDAQFGIIFSSKGRGCCNKGKMKWKQFQTLISGHFNFTPILRQTRSISLDGIMLRIIKIGGSQCSIFTTLKNFAWIRKRTMSSFDLCPCRSCLVLSIFKSMIPLIIFQFFSRLQLKDSPISSISRPAFTRQEIIS